MLKNGVHLTRLILALSGLSFHHSSLGADSCTATAEQFLSQKAFASAREKFYGMTTNDVRTFMGMIDAGRSDMHLDQELTDSKTTADGKQTANGYRRTVKNSAKTFILDFNEQGRPISLQLFRKEGSTEQAKGFSLDLKDDKSCELYGLKDWNDSSKQNNENRRWDSLVTAETCADARQGLKDLNAFYGRLLNDPKFRNFQKNLNFAREEIAGFTAALKPWLVNELESKLNSKINTHDNGSQTFSGNVSHTLDEILNSDQGLGLLTDLISAVRPKSRLELEHGQRGRFILRMDLGSHRTPNPDLYRWLRKVVTTGKIEVPEFLTHERGSDFEDQLMDKIFERYTGRLNSANILRHSGDFFDQHSRNTILKAIEGIGSARNVNNTLDRLNPEYAKVSDLTHFESKQVRVKDYLQMCTNQGFSQSGSGTRTQHRGI